VPQKLFQAPIYKILEVLRTREDFAEIQDDAEMCVNYVLGD